MTVAQFGHDTAHVADAGRPKGGDGPVDGRGGFRIGQLPGQEFLDDADLGFFLLGQFQTAPFLIGPGGFLAPSVPSPSPVRAAISRSLMAAPIRRSVDRRALSLAFMASLVAACRVARRSMSLPSGTKACDLG